jgi:hypothetical protein
MTTNVRIWQDHVHYSGFMATRSLFSIVLVGFVVHEIEPGHFLVSRVSCFIAPLHISFNDRVTSDLACDIYMFLLRPGFSAFLMSPYVNIRQLKTYNDHL